MFPSSPTPSVNLQETFLDLYKQRKLGKYRKCQSNLDLRHKLLLAILSKSKKAKKVIKVPKLGSFCSLQWMAVSWRSVFLLGGGSYRRAASGAPPHPVTPYQSPLDAP